MNARATELEAEQAGKVDYEDVDEVIALAARLAERAWRRRGAGLTGCIEAAEKARRGTATATFQPDPARRGRYAAQLKICRDVSQLCGLQRCLSAFAREYARALAAGVEPPGGSAAGRRNVPAIHRG
ncbi:hypothetical protein [Sorangium sp. So ce1097]|uniref:hypothetical protein n=1 Tax=Sorangium sp. So ce1097 TaxID=3133330 RepID=UPI003F606847